MLLCACSYYLGCSIYTGLQKTKNYKGVDLVGATHRFGNFLLGRRVEVHFRGKLPIYNSGFTGQVAESFGYFFVGSFFVPTNRFPI